MSQFFCPGVEQMEERIVPANVQLISHSASLISETASGASSTTPAPGPSISQDGRYVAFTSGAANVVAGQVDNNNTFSNVELVIRRIDW
jgi:hypothetical protein